MQLQRVPLIIHVPGQKGKVVSKVSVKLILSQRSFIYLVLKQINPLNLELTYLLKKARLW